MEEFLEPLLQLRQYILRNARTDSCILSTAVGCEFLTQRGILAEPLPVQVMIFNKKFVEHAERVGRLPIGNELESWSKEDSSYSVAIGLGGDPLPGKWPGHLVILAEKSYLIDLSIDQANRPEYGMVFEPIFCKISNSFFSEPMLFSYADCIFRYDAKPNNLGFLSSPDWMIASRRQNILHSYSRDNQ